MAPTCTSRHVINRYYKVWY